MSRARALPEAPVLGFIRITFADALAWYEAQEPTHPGNILGECPFIEIMVYPDLVVGEPEPVSPDMREALIEAMAEGFVSAYRRQQEPLASQGRSSIVGSRGITT